MTKSILITGANGLLARNLIDLCVLQGWQVYGISRDSKSNEKLLWDRIVLDLNSTWDERILPRSVDAVVHLAQSSNHRSFPEQAIDLYGVNVFATARLLHYARLVGASHFVFASTGGVYVPDKSFLNENSPIHDIGNLGSYFGSKVCGEIMVRSFSPYMQTTIVRPFYIYGQGQKRTVHIPRIYENVAMGKAIQLQGVDGVSMNPIHVSDAAQALYSILCDPQVSLLNIAGGEILNIRQIAEGFANHLGLKPKFEQIPGEPQSLISDITLMCDRFHEPKIRLFDSIEDIAG